MAIDRPINAGEVLEALRKEGCQEYGLRGTDAIAAWFFRIGYCYRPPSRTTIFRWKRKYRCPIVAPRHNSKLWTTNLLLMAWAAAQVRAQAKRALTGRKPRLAERRILTDRHMVAEALRKKLFAASVSSVSSGADPQEQAAPSDAPGTVAPTTHRAGFRAWGGQAPANQQRPR